MKIYKWIYLQILIGDDSVYTELKDLCETWYHMLVSKMLYQKPTVKSIDLHYYVQVNILFAMNSLLM
jgi:nuclear pore complex protein Nup85